MGENLEIKIKEGLNELKFGLGMEDVKKILGNPDEKETTEEAEEQTEIWYYWEDGVIVFFDLKLDKRCICLELENTDAFVFGKKIADLTEDEAEKLFAKNGYNEIGTEEETWGEKRLSIDDAVTDIYFENGKLTAINWGVDYDDDENPLWP
jgi:hypothetical protein